MNIQLKIFLLFPVILSQQAASQNNTRFVKGHLLTSRSLPPINIKFDKNFMYAGRQSFILFTNSTVEQFYFVNTDREKNIKAVYTVQFESYLPNNNLTYDYKITDSIKLRNKYYLYSAIFNQPQKNLLRDTSSDGAYRWKFLLSKGYYLPADAIGYRFIRLVDKNRRSEILIIYHEDLKDSNVTEEELDKDEKKLKKVLSQVLLNAKQGFQIF